MPKLSTYLASCIAGAPSGAALPAQDGVAQPAQQHVSDPLRQCNMCGIRMSVSYIALAEHTGSSSVSLLYAEENPQNFFISNRNTCMYSRAQI